MLDEGGGIETAAIIRYLRSCLMYPGFRSSSSVRLMDLGVRGLRGGLGGTRSNISMVVAETDRSQVVGAFGFISVADCEALISFGGAGGRVSSCLYDHIQCEQQDRALSVLLLT